ncbi:hypothetical protein N8I77_002719 [Diaporthe amygdali]|uniref:Uncharacterized protein n=1 Tax=Phomopsis amygdali TaxID=1214568 RepID=A0AAD9SUU0_PHOAM|nr:hypothetical protein N8I77_002719 [Diaporthe amygdali]
MRCPQPSGHPLASTSNLHWTIWAIPDTWLKTIIKEFNVQNKFGLHLVHRHVKMAKGMVMIGKPLDLGALHGYVFVLGGDEEIHPYKFRQSPPPPMTANDDAFITAVQKYLQLNGLTGIIGIELLDQDTLGKHMKEFFLSGTDGTVLLSADAINPTETYRTTGWRTVEGLTDLKGIHQVFVDGKALSDMEGNSTPEEAIIEALREAGIVN